MNNKTDQPLSPMPGPSVPDGTAPPSPELPPPPSKTWWQIAREWFQSLAIAVLLALFIRSFFVQAFKIPSGSGLNGSFTAGASDTATTNPASTLPPYYALAYIQYLGP